MIPQTDYGHMETDVGIEWGHYNSSVGSLMGASVTDKFQSHHRGHINVSFCDGSSRGVRNDMDIAVYEQLMTPWSKGCPTGSANPTPSASDTVTTRPTPDYMTVLDEGDY